MRTTHRLLPASVFNFRFFNYLNTLRSTTCIPKKFQILVGKRYSNKIWIVSSKSFAISDKILEFMYLIYFAIMYLHHFLQLFAQFCSIYVLLPLLQWSKSPMCQSAQEGQCLLLSSKSSFRLFSNGYIWGETFNSYVRYQIFYRKLI